MKIREPHRAPAYFEVRITTDLDSGEVLALLDGEGLTGAWEAEGVVHLCWPAGLWTPRARQAVEAALRALEDPGAVASMTVEPLLDRDWNEAWTRSITPIRIGQRVLVRQSWNPVVTPAPIELVIDPRQAFGTGQHATTQLLVEFLEDRVRGGERILDLGTGSAVLSMVALRLGGKTALGIDHDPVAIECAREYADINGFGAELELTCCGISSLEAISFDIVLANLDRNTLLENASAIVRHVGAEGILLITGLLVEDYSEIVHAFAAAGASERSRRSREEWLALELVHRKT